MPYGLLSKMLKWMDGVDGVDTSVLTTTAPAVLISGTSNLDSAFKFHLCSLAFDAMFRI